MITKRLFKAATTEGGIAATIATIGISASLPILAPFVVAIPTATLGADAVIWTAKAVSASRKRRAEKREKERERQHELQLQRERIAEAERAEERRRANQPKPMSKQEWLDALNADLLANLRILDLSLIPDEDKEALRNREIDVYQTKLRRVLEG